jgi:hypothetical protein
MISMHKKRHLFCASKSNLIAILKPCENQRQRIQPIEIYPNTSITEARKPQKVYQHWCKLLGYRQDLLTYQLNSTT